MSLYLRILAAALLLAGAGAAPAQEQFGEWDATVPQIQQMIEMVREQMLQPGDHVPGWDRGGANPNADLRAAGVESHYFRLRSARGDGIGILSARSIASLAPPAWRVVDTYGSATTKVDEPTIHFEALSARYVMAIRAGTERRRDADCMDEVANATLYERPDMPPGEDDDSIRMVFRLTFLAIEGHTVCTRTEGNREEGYRALVFLPDGRLLPRLNEGDDHMTIIPAGPIDQLVTYIDVDGTS
jgi:hypothetical protein